LNFVYEQLSKSPELPMTKKLGAVEA